MKKLFLLLLISCLLAGCCEPVLFPEYIYITGETEASVTTEVTLPTETAPTTEPMVQTEIIEETTPPFGWLEDEKGSYFQNLDGSRVTGWFTWNAQQYYFDQDGYCCSGWKTLDGVRYYFREDGTMAKGAVVIDGVTRHFTSTGAYVVVVNPWNAVPEDYEMNLVALSSEVAVSGCYVQESCLEPMTRMIRDCNRLSGSNVCVVSAYRSYELQESNFNNKVNTYLNAGYGQDEAYAAAAAVIAVPGTSEHHLGLAADIVDTQDWSLEEVQAQLKGQQWLMAHCHEYGFILRYPSGKTDVTGIIYEPWHYRYVGVELATELKDLGLTVEEYMANLTQ